MGGAVFLMFDHYDVAKEVNYYRSGDVEDAITTICRALRIVTKSKITYPRSIEEFEFTTEDHMILFIKHLFEELSEKQAYKLGLHRLMWTRYTKKELLVAQELLQLSNTKSKSQTFSMTKLADQQQQGQSWMITSTGQVGRLQYCKQLPSLSVAELQSHHYPKHEYHYSSNNYGIMKDTRTLTTSNKDKEKYYTPPSSPFPSQSQEFVSQQLQSHVRTNTSKNMIELLKNYVRSLLEVSKDVLEVSKGRGVVGFV